MADVKKLFIAGLLLLASCVPMTETAGGDAAARWQLTADAAAHELTATEWAWQATGQAFDATLQAGMAQATSTAIAAETMQALSVAGTQQAYQTTATADAAYGIAVATVMAGHAQSVELAAERERMMNPVKAAAPWVFLPLVFAALVVFGWRWTRMRVIPRDARGDAPLVAIDGRIYDADRHPYALMDIAKPQKVEAALQSGVVQRDQMLDLATRGLPGAGTEGRRRMMARQMAAQGMSIMPKIEILPAEEAKPLLGGVLQQIERDAIAAEGAGVDD
ncbi:MAG: hypothetical protein HPY45_09960 [Anaerolineae bacterium]|nr:hypothetical protein [Anaerolineae bacterium]